MSSFKCRHSIHRMTERASAEVVSPTLIPRIQLTSDAKDDLLKFTLSGVDVSIANALRRILLSEIPILVFRVSPNEKNKCNIVANTCGLNNEIVKHRLSCIPIHVKDVENFPLKNYILEVNVQNNTETTMYVTTRDFVIKDLNTGQPLPEDKLREIFPPDDITGDFIDFVRLKARPSEDIAPKTLYLTCEFDIGTAKEDAAFNVVSGCSYGNTPDEAAQETALQQLKQKWKDDGKKPHEIDFEVANWRLLEAKRIFLKNSFDFVVETVGIYTNAELVTMGCSLLIRKLQQLDTLLEKNEVTIKTSENTLSNAFDIVLDNEDYTIGNVLANLLYEKYWQRQQLTFCAFKMLHPHDAFGMLRVAYPAPVEQSTIKGHLQACIADAVQIFTHLRKEFIKLLPR